MEKTEYKQIIKQIIYKYNHKPILEAFNILLKLFNNIINYPRDSKFKNFKKSNLIIRNKILIIDEALSLIYVLGYTKTDDDEILSFNGDYNNLLECVKYLNKKVKELEYEIKIKENSEKKQEEKKIINGLNDEINELKKNKNILENKIISQQDLIKNINSKMQQ